MFMTNALQTSFWVAAATIVYSTFPRVLPTQPSTQKLWILTSQIFHRLWYVDLDVTMEIVDVVCATEFSHIYDKYRGDEGGQWSSRLLRCAAWSRSKPLSHPRYDDVLKPGGLAYLVGAQQRQRPRAVLNQFN